MGLGWNGPTKAPNSGVIFPINLMNLVCFLILAELATRFNSVVIQIAGDLAGASTNLAQCRAHVGCQGMGARRRRIKR